MQEYDTSQSQTWPVFARLPLLDLLVSPTQLSLTCDSYASRAWHNTEELIAKMNCGTVGVFDMSIVDISTLLKNINSEKY